MKILLQRLAILFAVDYEEFWRSKFVNYIRRWAFCYTCAVFAIFLIGHSPFIFMYSTRFLLFTLLFLATLKTEAGFSSETFCYTCALFAIFLMGHSPFIFMYSTRFLLFILLFT
jgi:hypothetical protein